MQEKMLKFIYIPYIYIFLKFNILRLELLATKLQQNYITKLSVFYFIFFVLTKNKKKESLNL